MAKNTAYERIILKRTDTAGTVPTTPASPKNVNDHTVNIGTASGWTATDIYTGEMYVNTADEKIWVGMDSGPVLIQYSGSTPTFLDASDTPSSFSGAAGQYLTVNAGESAVTFSTISIGFNDLSDGTGLIANKYVQVNSAATAFEMVDINTYLTGLTDVTAPTATGQTLIQNSAGTYEFYDISTDYVTKATAQTISAVKTFSAIPVFSTGITLTTDYIDSVITNSALTGADNQNVPSTTAIKSYIDALPSVSAATNLVYTDTAQTISGKKIFSAGSTDFTQAVNITGATHLVGALRADDAIYFGQPQVEDAFRLYVNPSADLEIGKYDANTSAYTFLASFGSTKLRSLGFMTGATDTPSWTVTGITNGSGLTSNDYTLVTQSAIKSYVDAQVGTADTLSEVLALGNTSVGNNIQMSTTDEVRFNDANSKIYYNSDGQLEMYSEYQKVQTFGGDYYMTTGSYNISSNILMWDSTAYDGNYGTIAKPASYASNRTWTYPDATGTIALTSDIAASPDLAAVLASGNTTSGNDISISAGDKIIGDGDTQIEFNTYSQNDISLTTDNGSFGDEYLYLGNDLTELSSTVGGVFANVVDESLRLVNYKTGTTIRYGVGISSSDGEISTNVALIKGIQVVNPEFWNQNGNNNSNYVGVMVGSNNSTINSGVNNAVIVGGNNITADRSSVVYAPKLELDTQGTDTFIMKDVADGTRYEVYISGGTLTLNSL